MTATSKLLWAVVCTIVSISVLHYVLQYFQDVQIRDELETMCRDPTVHGSLCPLLCWEEFMRHAQFIQGTSGKILIWHEKVDFIIKTRRTNSNVVTADEKLSVNEFMTIANQVLELNSGIQFDEFDQLFDLENECLHQTFESLIFPRKNLCTNDTRMIYFRYFYELLLQQEYVMFRLVRTGDLLPPIIGHCGYWYSVPKLNPLPYAELALPDVAVKHALRILHFAEMAYNVKLEFCDINLGHFALTDDDDGKLWFVDGDNVYWRNALLRGSQHDTCQVDSDCDFFDCKIRCFNHTCGAGMGSNVFSTICAKLFSGYWTSVFGIGPHTGGLLGRIESCDMQDAVEFCGREGNSSLLFRSLSNS